MALVGALEKMRHPCQRQGGHAGNGGNGAHEAAALFPLTRLCLLAMLLKDRSFHLSGPRFACLQNGDSKCRLTEAWTAWSQRAPGVPLGPRCLRSPRTCLLGGIRCPIYRGSVSPEGQPAGRLGLQPLCLPRDPGVLCCGIRRCQLPRGLRWCGCAQGFCLRCVQHVYMCPQFPHRPMPRLHQCVPGRWAGVFVHSQGAAGLCPWGPGHVVPPAQSRPQAVGGLASRCSAAQRCSSQEGPGQAGSCPLPTVACPVRPFAG